MEEAMFGQAQNVSTHGYVVKYLFTAIAFSV